jgi:uncharacterized protein DUF3891
VCQRVYGLFTWVVPLRCPPHRPSVVPYTKIPPVIVRSAPDHLLLITQPDHARLAAQIMAEWRRDDLPGSALRDIILRATREHDDGWIEPDRAPIVDAATGRLLDFINAPEGVRQGIWPRGVERLRDRPYAAALVAEHALNVYEHYRDRPAWGGFFSCMEEMRDRALAGAAPRTLADLRRDYFFVRMGDLASLAFCNGWREPQKLARYELRLEGTELRFAPDPFDGARVQLTIAARRLPNRAYTSSADAAAAFESADEVEITGVACGQP